MTAPTNFVTRAQWGSSFDYSANTRMPSTPLGVALHWEGPRMGTWTHDQCDNKVRQIEDFHVEARGWAGIAYNALVCPHGYIFEGRGLRYRNAANGDPTKNGNYFAVCYVGGDGDPFTAEAKAAFIRAVRWFRSDGGAGTKVIGHRDVTSTACPGNVIETWLKATNFSTAGGTPAPVAPVWGNPATWVVGGKSADVLRLGQRINAWNAANGLATWEPDDVFSRTEVNALSILQSRVWGFGDDPDDLAIGGASDGFPGKLTFEALDAEPSTAPPVEIPETVTVKILLLPMAGYNGAGARGVTQWERNTKGLATLVNTHKPDLVGTTELSNRDIDPMLPLFTSLLEASYRRAPGGADGRYWFERKQPVEHIASGHVDVSDLSEFNSDDKQAAWLVAEVEDQRKGFIVIHTENESGIDHSGANAGENADDLRVDQTISGLARAYEQMKPHGIERSDILYTGDFNSEGMVKARMLELGWETTTPGWFTGWNDDSRKTYDWVFIRALDGGTVTVVRINHDFSDHTALLITWTFVKTGA